MAPIQDAEMDDVDDPDDQQYEAIMLEEAGLDEK